jgi:hypothetical protein
MKTSGTNRSTATASERWTTGSVSSKDGTTIGYRNAAATSRVSPA